jgi:hypothetical protein
MHTRMTTGFVMVIAGAIAIGASPVLIDFSDRDPDARSFAWAGGAMAAGFGLYIGGLAMMLTGQPHMYDAINVYNDDVDLRLQGLPSGFGAGALTPESAAVVPGAAPINAPDAATPAAP